MKSNSTKKCWICEETADSKEHKIKNSDVKKIFGSGSYKGEDAVVIVDKGVQREIQGSKSDLLKYSPVICNSCNNDYTQPFDTSYSQLIEYIDDNKELILHQRFIDFQDVYKEDFEKNQRNLYKYFVKSFGCRLAHYGHAIPQDMVELLSKDSFETGLRITFAVNEDKALFDIDSVGNGDLYSYGESLNYIYNEHYRWLHIYYYYDNPPDGSLGSTWIADNQYIYLGSFYPLSEDERNNTRKMHEH